MKVSFPKNYIRKIAASLAPILLVPTVVLADEHIQANSLLAEGKKQMAAGNYIEATKLLTSAQKRVVLPFFKKEIDSQASLNKSLVESSNNFNQGKSKYESSDLASAIEQLRKVSDKDINYKESQNLIKESEKKIQESKEAEEKKKAEEERKKKEEEEKKLAEDRKKKDEEVAYYKRKLAEETKKKEQGIVAGSKTIHVEPPSVSPKQLDVLVQPRYQSNDPRTETIMYMEKIRPLTEDFLYWYNRLFKIVGVAYIGTEAALIEAQVITDSAYNLANKVDSVTPPTSANLIHTHFMNAVTNLAWGANAARDMIANFGWNQTTSDVAQQLMARFIDNSLSEYENMRSEWSKFK